MKTHIVLTTRCGKIFSVNGENFGGDLEQTAQQIRAKMNAKYSGSDYEITDCRLAEASEVANFWELPPSIFEA